MFLKSQGRRFDPVLDEGFTFRHAGQVNGNYVVWTRCDVTCDVVRHDIVGASEIALAEPSATTYQYGAAVTSTGITYVARSGKSRYCRAVADTVSRRILFSA